MKKHQHELKRKKEHKLMRLLNPLAWEVHKEVIKRRVAKIIFYKAKRKASNEKA